MSARKRCLDVLSWMLAGLHRLVVLGLILVAIAGFIVWTANANRSPFTPTDSRSGQDPVAAVFPSPVRAASLSADGQFLDAWQGQATWRRFDAHTGRTLMERTLAGSSLSRVALRSQDEIVVTTSGGNVLEVASSFNRLWSGSLPEQDETELIEQHSVASHCNLIAAISTKGSLWLMEFDDDEVQSLSRHHIDHRLEHVAVAPRGDTVALIADGAGLLIWSVAQERVINRPADFPGALHAAQWSEDGSKLISFGGHDVQVWLTEPLEIVRRFTFHSNTIIMAVLSPTGRFAAVADTSDIRVLDVESGAELAVLSGHAGMISFLQFNNDERTLFSGDLRGELRRWSLLDGREIWSVQSRQAMPALPCRARTSPDDSEKKTTEYTEHTEGEKSI